MVEARGLYNRLFIDFGLGKPVDMAQVKTIGFFTDGDRRLAHPKTFYNDVGCFPMEVMCRASSISPLPPAK